MHALGRLDGQPHGKRVFISYGRADAQELADRLEADLKARGYDVWLDRSQMQSGQSWQEQIERAIEAADYFVAILSPHAVRRPDGVCLDEISMARFTGKKIVPCMALMCQPPLCIFRLDWVDVQQWLQESFYEKALERLITGLESEQPAEGVCARVFRALEPMDFGADLARLTREFTGRKWLFREFDQWVENDTGRVFLITGDPGAGKSAVMAYLTNTDQRITAFHMCVSGRSETLRPGTFVRSIAGQIATQMEAYRNQLNELDLERIIRETSIAPDELFRKIIVEPLRNVPSPGELIIAVDALDEGFAETGMCITRLLADCLQDLGRDLPWVRFVFSSRKEPEILDRFTRFKPHEIQADRAENRQDMDEFIARRLGTARLRDRLRDKGADPETVRGLIADRSQGNFLYVTRVLDSIEDGTIDPARAEDFPAGLVDSYFRFFERKFPTKRDFKELRPILEVVAAAREPMGPDEVGAFLGMAGRDVEDEMEQVRVFFPLKEGRYQPYHKSIVDWLSGRVGESTRYRLRLSEGHRLIAGVYWDKYEQGTDNLDAYGMLHLAHHLADAGEWDKAERLLTDLIFMEAKCRAGMFHSVLEDYAYVLDSLPEAQDERRRKEEDEKRLQKYTQDLIRVAKGELPLSELEIIPSVKPLSDEEKRHKVEALTTDPKLRRFHQIRAFSSFANAYSHVFPEYGAHPGFCAQTAYNHARSGPVAEAADPLVQDKNGPPMLLLMKAQIPEYDPFPALLRILTGHTNAVTCVSITPDGKKAVSASADKTVRVWDLENGQPIGAPLAGHTEGVTVVSITPDGRKAISGSADNTLRVWDLGTGQQIHGPLAGHACMVSSVSISIDGKRAVSGSGDQWTDTDTTLRAWDLETGQQIGGPLAGHTTQVTGVSITADGKKAVSASHDKTLRVWDLESLQQIGDPLAGHTKGVTGVSITPDGTKAVSGSEDNTLRVWNLETGQQIGEPLSGDMGHVDGVTITQDGKKAVSASSDRTLRIWDLETGHQIGEPLIGHWDTIATVSITPDGKRAVSGSRDGTLRVWDLENSQQIGEPLVRHADSVDCVSITPAGTNAVSGSHGLWDRDTTLRVWDLETGRAMGQPLGGHAKGVLSLSITPDGKKAVSGSWDGTQRVWDLDTHQPVGVVASGDMWVGVLRITPDGKRTVTGGSHGSLQVWELDTAQRIKRLVGHHSWVTDLSITLDGRKAISGSEDKTLRVWDLENGQEIGKGLTGHTGRVTSVSITPDGKTAVSASSDSTLRLWDLKTGQQMGAALAGHTGVATSVSITPDGKTALSASGDKTVRRWDIETGQQIGDPLTGHIESATIVRVTPDGKRALSGSEDSTLRVWELNSGRCLVIAECWSAIGPAECSADKVVVGTKSGRVLIFRLVGLAQGPAIVTARRLWRFGRPGEPGKWSSHITATCGWCGTEFKVPDKIVAELRAAETSQAGTHGSGPQPAGAGSSPASKTYKCPKCQKPIRLNPFVVDFSGR